MNTTLSFDNATTSTSEDIENDHENLAIKRKERMDRLRRIMRANVDIRRKQLEGDV